MKKYIYIISILLLLTVTFSCESFLEEVPRQQLSSANAFETADDLELAVNGCYDALQETSISGGQALFMPSDITYSYYTDRLPFANNRYVRDRWRQRYKGINICNTYLDNEQNVEMDDEEHRNELISEVLWLRSFLYFGLVRDFINIPMPLHETTNLNDVKMFQVSPDTVFSQIIKDLEFSLEHLDPQSMKDHGRVTKGAALALLSEVYLTLGSWEKRDGKGDGKAYFQKCADLSKQIIDSNEYSLVPYFPDVFHYKNEDNEEMIMAVKYTAGGIGEGTEILTYVSLRGWSSSEGGGGGSYIATVYYSTIWEESDSTRHDWANPHVNRDYATGKLYRIPDDVLWPPYTMAKYRIYPVYDGYARYDEPVDFVLFRYGGVLLNYAEALNEVHNGPNDEVFWALNKIRERARYVNGDYEAFQDVWPREIRYESNNVPDLDPEDYPDYQSIFDYLVLERARELGGEQKRWYDLTRWGILYERMNWIATYDDGNALPLTFPESDSEYKNNIESVKNGYFAIPPSEIEANPNLVQNPGF